MNTLTLRGNSPSDAKDMRGNPALAVFIGRFQPLHNGHLHVIHAALAQAENLLILIGSSSGPRSHRNPFTFEERKAMIQSVLRADEVGRVRIVGVPDHLYSDETWLEAVQGAIFDQARTHFYVEPNRQNTVLVGHSKDGTGYYLKRFPQFGALRLGNHKGLSATPMREALFRPDATRWLTAGSAVDQLPSQVRDWLNLHFVGTEAHQRLVAEYEFVRAYREKWRDAPFAPTFNTVDAVVICSGHVLLVERKGMPGQGQWALPGGFIKEMEPIDDAVIRELREETRLKVPSAVLRGCERANRVFADPHRSSRGRTITHAYLYHLPPGDLPEVRAASDAKKAVWWPLSDVREDMMFEDHFHIIHRLRAMAAE